MPTEKDISEKEVDMAIKLVKQETKPFIPEDLHDTYTDELEELIKDKAKGKKAAPHKKEAAHETSKDLMSALKASLKE